MSRAPNQFADVGLSAPLLKVVDELGYGQMTPVQAAGIPPLLAGKDLVGQSKTGSGKTAAYTLPILERVNLTGRRLQALVLCPTRELCTQVAREVRKLGRRHPGLQVLIVAGGLPSWPQKAALEKGVHIVVGTPGRVLDLMGRGKMDLSHLRCVVLDEADRMLDMGFRADIETILQGTPGSRQTVFFSATFPESIADMSRAHQKSPVWVKVDQGRTDAPAVDQKVVETTRDRKPQVLLALLAEQQPESALVFCNHIGTTDELAAHLTAAGHSACALHGGLEQADRDRVMARFRNRSVRILIATDVASRGLDVENLDLVVNFDLPSTPEVYVHRIGRTGRAGRGGLAMSLVTANDRVRLAAAEEAVGIRLERINPPALTGVRENAARNPRQVAAMETLYISGGRKDKVRPSDILGALTGQAGGLSGELIGKIEIHDRFSYVAVAKHSATAALAGLRAGHIKGRKFHAEMVR